MINDTNKEINSTSCCSSSLSECSCCSNDADNYRYKDLSHCTEKYIKTPVGEIAVINTTMYKKDIAGAIKVRWGIRRNDYRVKPNLYAIGNPDEKSPVLVTANFKLTFDLLRRELVGISAWILVLDTKGINVWCAAGKGTFGTDELINKIEKFKLSKIISHKNIILPQLGAPGIKSHEVTKETGLKVVYGPVRAEDIKAFLESSLKADNKMRRVRFSFKDRFIITPIELVQAFKYLPIFFVFFIIYNFIGKESIGILDVILKSLQNILPFVGAFVIGAFLVPVLLPFIPFRAFSLKGLSAGVIWAMIILLLYNAFNFPLNVFFKTAVSLLIISVVSYLSLNFTGASTYTSFSGVELETRIALPIIL